MVRAYHIIMTAYGFWLPNDPRGSRSDFIGAWELLRFGKATTVTTRRSLAQESHNQQLREEVKAQLRYSPVNWTGEQARGIARGFAKWFEKKDISVHACAILPEHVHLVVRRPESGLPAEQIANHIKGAATRQLIEDGIHPFDTIRTRTRRHPKMFARGCWTVFLNSDTAIRRAIRYVEENPLKEGKRRQHWRFVQAI